MGAGSTLLGEMRLIIGRLNFVAGVLEYERPFLSIMYKWQAAVAHMHRASLPWAIKLVMEWLARRLQEVCAFIHAASPSSLLCSAQAQYFSMIGFFIARLGAHFAHNVIKKEDPRPELKMAGLRFYAQAATQMRFINVALHLFLVFANTVWQTRKSIDNSSRRILKQSWIAFIERKKIILFFIVSG